VFIEIANSSGGYVDPEMRSFLTRAGLPPREYSNTVYLAFLGWQVLGPLAFAAILRWRMRGLFVGARGLLKAYAASVAALVLTMTTVGVLSLSLNNGEAAGPRLLTSPPPRRAQTQTFPARPATSAIGPRRVSP